MASLVELEKSLEQKQGELAKLFQDHKKDDGYDFTSEEVEEVNRRNDELTKIGKEREAAKSLFDIETKNQREWDETRRQKAPPMPQGDLNPLGTTAKMVENAYKTLGAMIAETKAISEYRGGEGPISTLDDFSLKGYFDARNQHFGLRPDSMKTTMLTSAGWPPFVTRGPKVLLSALEMPVVADLIPQTQTTQAAIKYIEETTYTNAAAPVSEGAVKPEAALALTERTALVSKIAVNLPVSKEQLDDVPRVRDYIDNRLTLMVEQTLENQILTGTGTPPQLAGILGGTYTNLLNQARGTDPGPDAIYKAMLQIRVTGKAAASGIVMNPTDWANIRLLRTVEGIYLWGNPSETGADRIWGLPVIQTTNLTAGNAIVADWTYSELVTREGVNIQVGYINDDFTRNLQRIVCEIRAAFLIYRQQAFCRVTGL
jgi:hypothetical protein